LREGSISRRAFVRRATAAGMSTAAATMLVRSAGAQAATPEASASASPVTSGEVINSVTREEYLAQLAAAFPFEEAASKGGQVIMVSTTDIKTLNPHVRTDVAASYIIGPMFNGLVTTSPIDGSMVPDLADYWEMSADGLTYTFYLNQKATWHDGNPLTAADVVFSFDAVLGEGSLVPYQSDVVQVVKSYQALDDYTFQMTATAATALFLPKAVGAFSVMPKHIWEGIPLSEWGSAPGSTGSDPAQVIGSGPFRFGEWVANDHATIVRNDDYWYPDLLPNIDSFSLQVNPESSAAVQTLITAETDIATIQPSMVESIQTSNPEIGITSYDSWRFNILLPNQDEASGTFFKDVNLRKALYYALDRDLIVQEILFGYGVRGDGPQPPLSPAYDPENVTPLYEYDPEQAKSLLEASGWVDSDGDGIREKDGVKLSMEFPYIEGGVNTQLVPYLQQSFKDVGMEILPVAGPQPTIIDRIMTMDYQLSIIGITWYADGDQGVLFRCESASPNGFNLAHWCNPEYDALDDQQVAELDRDKRMGILKEMSNIVSEDAANTILYFDQGIVGNQPRLKNFFPNGYGITWSINWMWVDPTV
jgi:peptide/nickel transport system substrate-binding protein